MAGLSRKHMKSLLLLLLLSTVSHCEPVVEPAEKTFTVQDATLLALQNDSRLLSAQQDKIITSERVREARYQFLPEFGVQASATKFDARYPFSLSQDFRNILLFPGTPENIYSGRGYMHLSLYEGGRTVSTMRLAQAAQKQASSNVESVRLEVIYAAKEAFYRTILAQEKLAAAERARVEAETLTEKGGLGSWDRIEAEALAEAARARGAEAERALTAARLNLLKTVNLELDTPFRVSGTLDAKPSTIELKNVVLWAMELRPELQSETYKAEMDAISVNLALSRRNPTIFLAGDYELTDQRFPIRHNNWDATIGIKLPLSYDYFTEIRRKKAEQRQGQLKRAALQDQVRLEVRQAYDDLQHWQAEWPRREARYRKVQTLYDGVSAAAGAPLSRVRALTGLLDLRLSYLTASMEHILARARLERAVGRELDR